MPMLLIFKGLPGTGKTTLASQLHKKFGWKLVVRDNIKEELTRQNIPPSEVGKESYKIMWHELDDLLSNQHSVICDTNINHPSALPELEKIVKKTGSKVIVVECYCVNEEEHKRRLDERKDQNLSSFWIDSWDKFQKYLKSNDNQGNYEIPYKVLKVDTCSLPEKEKFMEVISKEIALDDLHRPL